MLGVQGDARLGHHHGNGLAGGAGGEHLLHDGGGAATDHGDGDDGHLGAPGHVGAAAQAAPHLARGAGEDVHVKVRVHLQRAKNAEVLPVEIAALAVGVGIVRFVDLDDAGAAADGLGGHRVEGLAAL